MINVCEERWWWKWENGFKKSLTKKNRYFQNYEYSQTFVVSNLDGIIKNWEVQYLEQIVFSPAQKFISLLWYRSRPCQNMKGFESKEKCVHLRRWRVVVHTCKDFVIMKKSEKVEMSFYISKTFLYSIHFDYVLSITISSPRWIISICLIHKFLMG